MSDLSHVHERHSIILYHILAKIKKWRVSYYPPKTCYHSISQHRENTQLMCNRKRHEKLMLHCLWDKQLANPHIYICCITLLYQVKLIIVWNFMLSSKFITNMLVNEFHLFFSSPVICEQTVKLYAQQFPPVVLWSKCSNLGVKTQPVGVAGLFSKWKLGLLYRCLNSFFYLTLGSQFENLVFGL